MVGTGLLPLFLTTEGADIIIKIISNERLHFITNIFYFIINYSVISEWELTNLTIRKVPSKSLKLILKSSCLKPQQFSKEFIIFPIRSNSMSTCNQQTKAIKRNSSRK